MSQTRRDVLTSLAGVGVAGLAGYTALDTGESDSDDPALDPTALREAMELGSPAFPARVPAPIADSFLEQSRGRARELLDSCPEAMSPEEVPNEATRNVYAEAYADTTAILAPPDTDESSFEALRGLRYAREAAAMAKGIYDATVGDLAEADVRGEAESARAGIESPQRATRYLGNDPDRVFVVYEAVENLVAGTARSLDNVDEYDRYADSIPRVGEPLDTVEPARASSGGAYYARDRYLASIANPIDFANAFALTASSLGGVAEDRRAEYPEKKGLEAVVAGEGFDLEQFESTPVKDLLVEVFVEVGRGLQDARGSLRNDHFAIALVGAHTAETHRRVFEDAATAVKRGRYEPAESTAVVRDAKLGALGALEAIRSNGSNPHLTRHALIDIVHMVTRGDDYFRDDYYKNGDPRAVRNALAQYAVAEFAARGTSGVSTWVLGTLAVERGDVGR